MVQRFRAVLLAFGMLALVAGAAAGVFADRGQDQRDHGLREAGGTGVAAAADYLEQQRSVALVVSHSAAFARFYDAPGTRTDRTFTPDVIAGITNSALVDNARAWYRLRN